MDIKERDGTGREGKQWKEGKGWEHKVRESNVRKANKKERKAREGNK